MRKVIVFLIFTNFLFSYEELTVDNFDEKDLAYIFNKLDVQNKRECLKAYFLSIIDNLANENDKDKSDDNS